MLPPPPPLPPPLPPASLAAGQPKRPMGLLPICLCLQSLAAACCCPLFPLHHSKLVNQNGRWDCSPFGSTSRAWSLLVSAPSNTAAPSHPCITHSRSTKMANGIALHLSPAPEPVRRLLLPPSQLPPALPPAALAASQTSRPTTLLMHRQNASGKKTSRAGGRGHVLIATPSLAVKPSRGQPAINPR